MAYYDDNVNEIHGTDLRPMYRLKNDNIKVSVTEIKSSKTPSEVLKKIAEAEKETILKRERNFNEGVNFYENFQKVDIELIEDTPPGWNLFDKPKETEIAELMRSVENVGLLEPVYLTLDPGGTYTVICGRLRLLAFIGLYQETGLLKYKFIPSYVIDSTSVDEFFLRSMIIESNIRFRSISKFNMIQSLIQNYEIMKKMKLYRSESNVAKEIARILHMSESNVFNLLRVKKLCDPALTLLYEERITLKAALYLTKVSKETQENILEKFGVDGVNKIYKLKLITKEGNISLEKLEEKIDELKSYTPPKTKIILEVSREFVNPLLEYLLNFKKEQINPFANKHTRGVTTSAFRVRYDAEAMNLYAKQNIIDEITLKKLIAKLSYEKIG